MRLGFCCAKSSCARRACRRRGLKAQRARAEFVRTSLARVSDCKSLYSKSGCFSSVLVNSQLTPALLLHMAYSNRLVWPQQWHYHTQTRCADGLLLLHIYSADYLYAPAVVNCEVGSTECIIEGSTFPPADLGLVLPTSQLISKAPARQLTAVAKNASCNITRGHNAIGHRGCYG